MTDCETASTPSLDDDNDGWLVRGTNDATSFCFFSQEEQSKVCSGRKDNNSTLFLSLSLSLE